MAQSCRQRLRVRVNPVLTWSRRRNLQECAQCCTMTMLTMLLKHVPLPTTWYMLAFRFTSEAWARPTCLRASVVEKIFRGCWHSVVRESGGPN